MKYDSHMGSTPPDGKVLRTGDGYCKRGGKSSKGGTAKTPPTAQKGFTTARMTIPTISSAGTSFITR